jgi:hypothetical protein
MGNALANSTLKATTTSNLKSDKHERDNLLFFCPEDDNGRGFEEMVGALYYLPSSYRLIVLNHITSQENEIMPWADKKIMDRIEFEKEGLSEKEMTPSFSNNGIVVHGGNECEDAKVNKSNVPQVVISDTADDIASDHHNGFVVGADNPEALASAILRISGTCSAYA